MLDVFLDFGLLPLINVEILINLFSHVSRSGSDLETLAGVDKPTYLGLDLFLN